MELTSSAFSAGDSLPERYTCEGDDVSPPLAWRYLPDGTASLALIMDDPDAPAGVFCHWAIYNIPAEVDHFEPAIPKGSRTDAGATQGRNDLGNAGYDGPCPPQGETHTYYLRLYALDSDLDLPAGLARAQLLDEIRDHVLDRTEMQVSFGRG